ncbi:hypothetical protein LSH36_246g06028 [Paralvinella palmiformis]|uniref:Uncharacterized protein n=1 Tax=Paralvinella palmiformis TaxID=53620 RepID=A0AAD9JLD6_9ANNE|nr:hypothetical protein LSH36_246g06028 [Paralvinella palmiformis]
MGKKLKTMEDVNEHCGDITLEKKYLVFHNKLMELFQCCPICAGPSQPHEWRNGEGGANLSTYQHHQNEYVIPTVFKGWKQKQVAIMVELRHIEGGLQLAGDCRNDSTGHCEVWNIHAC